jgi:hypothetical protein
LPPAQSLCALQTAPAESLAGAVIAETDGLVLAAVREVGVGVGRDWLSGTDGDRDCDVGAEAEGVITGTFEDGEEASIESRSALRCVWPAFGDDIARVVDGCLTGADEVYTLSVLCYVLQREPTRKFEEEPS